MRRLPDHDCPAGLAASLGCPHPRPFVAELVVAKEHLSRAVPHANNAEYVRWLDRVAELHSDSLGFTRDALLGEDRCWFVVRHEVDYLAECWEGERLLLFTWVRSIRRTTSWRDTLIHRPSDRTVVAKASTLWAYIDLATRRPARVPSEMAAAFEPLEAPARAPEGR